MPAFAGYGEVEAQYMKQPNLALLLSYFQLSAICICRAFDQKHYKNSVKIGRINRRNVRLAFLSKYKGFELSVYPTGGFSPID